MEQQQEALDRHRTLKEEQQRGIGATDTPKILGIDRYGTALTVYERLIGVPQEDRDSLPAWLGMQLQNTVAELYTTATGLRVRADNRQHQHPEDEWLVCHLDYRVWGDPNILVECKTRAYTKGWGPDGSTEIPPDVWAQVQHEMLVTGTKECHVAVLFGHHTFRVYPIKRDEAFIKALRGSLYRFYHEHVLARVPPPAGPDDGRTLSKAHPQDDGEMLTATAQQNEMVKELLARERTLTVAERLVSEQQNAIKQALGEAQGFYSVHGTVTWKTTKARRYVNYEQIFIEMLDLLPEEDGIPEQVNQIMEIHTTVKPGTRRFTFSPSKLETS